MIYVDRAVGGEGGGRRIQICIALLSEKKPTFYSVSKALNDYKTNGIKILI